MENEIEDISELTFRLGTNGFDKFVFVVVVVLTHVFPGAKCKHWPGAGWRTLGTQFRIMFLLITQRVRSGAGFTGDWLT